MPTPKQEYIRSLRDIARRFNSLEQATIERALQYLEELQVRLQLELTAAEGWNAFRLQQLTAAVNRLTLEYEARLMALTNSAIRESARLGALSVIEPIQAAGLTAGFFQPTPAQINVLLDFSAELIRGIGGETRQMINQQISMAALGERSPIQAMQAINRRLGIADSTGIAYRGERIVRTDVARVFNISNHSQQLITAQSVPGLGKQWLSARIPKRTRPSHWAAHDQIVPVNDPFRVGGEDLMYPLDPAGSADNTINCLCRMVTVHPAIGPINVRLAQRARV